MIFSRSSGRRSVALFDVVVDLHASGGHGALIAPSSFRRNSLRTTVQERSVPTPASERTVESGLSFHRCFNAAIAKFHTSHRKHEIFLCPSVVKVELCASGKRTSSEVTEIDEYWYSNSSTGLAVASCACRVPHGQSAACIVLTSHYCIEGPFIIAVWLFLLDSAVTRPVREPPYTDGVDFLEPARD